MLIDPLPDLPPPLFRVLLRLMKPGPESVPEQRARMDLRGLAVPVPGGVERSNLTVAGVPCERLRPRSLKPGRAMLYLHGGGYTVGSPRSTRHYVARIAATGGAEALVPEYRLAPEHPFPAALSDALAVYSALLKGHAPGQIVVAGDSAGAGLAISLCLAARETGTPLPGCLHLLSPWTDLAADIEATRGASPKDAVCFPDELGRMARDYVGAADPRDPLVSPLYASLTGLPPMLIQAGGDERLIADSTRFAERAKAAGVEVTLQVAPDMQHVYPLFHRMLSPAREAIAEAGGWIDQRLA